MPVDSSQLASFVSDDQDSSSADSSLSPVSTPDASDDIFGEDQLSSQPGLVTSPDQSAMSGEGTSTQPWIDFVAGSGAMWWPAVAGSTAVPSAYAETGKPIGFSKWTAVLGSNAPANNGSLPSAGGGHPDMSSTKNANTGSTADTPSNIGMVRMLANGAGNSSGQETGTSAPKSPGSPKIRLGDGDDWEGDDKEKQGNIDRGRSITLEVQGKKDQLERMTGEALVKTDSTGQSFLTSMPLELLSQLTLTQLATVVAGGALVLNQISVEDIRFLSPAVLLRPIPDALAQSMSLPLGTPLIALVDSSHVSGLVGDQLAATEKSTGLGTKTIPAITYLTQTQVPYLTSSQFYNQVPVAHGVGDLLQLLTSDQKKWFTPTQLNLVSNQGRSNLRTNHASIYTLPPHLIAELSRDSLFRIKANDLSKLSKEQTQALNVRQLDAREIGGLNVGDLSKVQIRSLYRVHVNRLTYEQFKKIQKGLTSDQLQRLGPNLTSQLSTDDLLSKNAVDWKPLASLLRPLDVRSLPSSTLTAKVLKAFGPDQLAALTEDQLISKVTLPDGRKTELINLLDDKQIGSLSPTALALRVLDNLAKRGKVSALTTDQLTPEVIGHLGPFATDISPRQATPALMNHMPLELLEHFEDVFWATFLHSIGGEGTMSLSQNVVSAILEHNWGDSGVVGKFASIQLTRSVIRNMNNSNIAQLSQTQLLGKDEQGQVLLFTILDAKKGSYLSEGQLAKETLQTAFGEFGKNISDPGLSEEQMGTLQDLALAVREEFDESTLKTNLLSLIDQLKTGMSAADFEKASQTAFTSSPEDEDDDQDEGHGSLLSSRSNPLGVNYGHDFASTGTPGTNSLVHSGASRTAQMMTQIMAGESARFPGSGSASVSQSHHLAFTGKPGTNSSVHSDASKTAAQMVQVMAAERGRFAGSGSASDLPIALKEMPGVTLARSTLPA